MAEPVPELVPPPFLGVGSSPKSNSQDIIKSLNSIKPFKTVELNSHWILRTTKIIIVSRCMHSM